MSGRPLYISFSGVDGAGKSTVIERLTQLLEQNDQRVVLLRSRPSILPILSSFKFGKKNAELYATDRIPRQGTNRSVMGSFLRFLYYFLDYFFGQIVVFLKYRSKEIIVIYDRFYFDLIVDPRRSNITINRLIPKLLGRFIFFPQLNFFLYASPEIIMARKNELDKAAIIELTSGYLKLFSDYQITSRSEFLCLNNVNLDETISVIESYCKGQGS